MSLVGTRPPTVDEWEKYELHHRSRMSTKPGITGMWQVSGRSDITDFEEVVRLDTEYIEHWTMPTNLYGPNDNYHPTHSHVVPALIRRFHEAKVNGLESVVCWGDGSPLREFLYVDDLANLCVFLMNHYSGNETVNAGTGKELTIRELTELVAKAVGYTGKIEWDTSRPNGTPRKLLDVSKAAKLGWTYKTELEDGLRLSYEAVYDERTCPSCIYTELEFAGVGLTEEQAKAAKIDYQAGRFPMMANLCSSPSAGDRCAGSDH